MRSLTLLLCLTACRLPDAAPADGTGLLPYPQHIEDLANGLRLVTIPTDYPDTVSLHIIVHVGSRHEVEAGKSGFAHFFEHMMFRGSENFSAAEQARLFKQAGADRNAYTTDDYTNYHTTFAKEDLAQVLELEADRFRRLKYGRGVFRTESQAVFGEYNKNSANPVSKMFEVVRNASFDRHTYKHTTMGFLRDIVKMPRQYDYSLEFFRRFYKPENVTILLVGDVQPAQCSSLVRRYFGDWARGDYRAEIPAEPPQTAARRCHVPWPSPTPPWICIAFKGPAFDPAKPEMPALDVLASVAFSPSSELYQRLFVREQKVDSLFSYFPDHKDPYLLMIMARLKDEQDLAYVRDQILSTCESLKTTAISSARLEAVKRNLKYSFAAGLDSSPNIADSLAGHIAQTRTPQTIDTLFSSYAAVDAARVQEVARRFFVPETRTLCTLTHQPEVELKHAKAPVLPPIRLRESSLEATAAVPSTEQGAAPWAEKPVVIPAGVLLKPGRSPLISLRIAFPVGAAQDPQGKEGLCYLTSRMLVAAATRKRSYADLVTAMFPMAAGVGASVDKQLTTLSGSIHRDNLVPYTNLLLEMLGEPAFAAADLQRIRANTIAAIDAGLRRSDDEETGKEVLYQELYRGHPYGHLNRGSIASLKAISLADIRDFYAKHFKGPFLGISGGYPAAYPGYLAAQLGEKFGPCRDIAGAAARHDYRQGVPVLRHNRLTIIEKNTRATGIHLGFPIEVNRGHPDFAALWLIRSYFGEHRSENSYLYQRLREIRGLNYGDYAYIEYFPNGGGQFHPSPNLPRSSQIFQIWIRPVPPHNGPFTLKAMQYELSELCREGMSRRAFEATRTYLEKFVNNLVASQDRQLGYAIDSRFYGIDEFVPYMKARLASLSLDEVNAALRRHLRAERLQYVVVTQDAKAFTDALLGAAPTPITYTSRPGPEVLAEDARIEKLKIDLRPENIRVLPVEEVFAR